MLKQLERETTSPRRYDPYIDGAIQTALAQSKEKTELEQNQEARYGVFLGILAEKLGVSGLNTDQEALNHAAVLAEQLNTIKKVFDQLSIVSNLLRLSPEQTKPFAQFRWNSKIINDIIPALDSGDLNHQNLSAFANSLKPTIFTSYEQILGIAQINDPTNSENRRKIIAQLMSDLGVNKFSIRKLVKFFETQPTLAQVRAEIAKRGKLERLYWTFATLLGVAVMSIACVPATPETTTPATATVTTTVEPSATPPSTPTAEPTTPPNTPTTEPSPTPVSTPTIVPPAEMGGPLTPEQIAETEQMMIDRNIKQQANQVIPGITILAIDELSGIPTQPDEDSGYYPFALKRLGDSLALEEIGIHQEDSSRHYIFFDHKNNKVALIKADANSYITIDSTGNWVVLNADGQPAQEIEWQKVVSEEAPQPEGEHQLVAINRSLSIKFFVDQSAPEISDPAELERFTKLRDFLPELLEMRGEIYLRVNEYLGVNFGEADLQKMHLSLNRNGSNFELILHDARTGENQEVNLGTISADENFIYINGEQLAQHPQEYKITYAGAEFTMRYVGSWPEQIVTINPALVAEYFMRCIMHNPDMWQHLGAEKPFESPEEVVAFYLQQQAEGKELLVPISIFSGEPGKYNEVYLAPGDPFDIDLLTFLGVDRTYLNMPTPSSRLNSSIIDWIEVDPETQSWRSIQIVAGDKNIYSSTPLVDQEASEYMAIPSPTIIASTPVGAGMALTKRPNMRENYPDLANMLQDPSLVTRKKP